MKHFLLALLVFSTAFASAQKVSSKLSFQKGQKLEVTSNINTTMEMAMGESNSSAVNTEIYEVKDVSGTSTTLEHTVKSIKLDLSLMGQEKKIDSDNPDDLKGMVGEPVKELLKTKNEFIVDATGKVTDVKGEAKKKTGGNAMSGMMMQQMNIGSAVPKVGNASIFKILPDHEVGKGDSWTDSLDDASAKTIIKYTITDITDTDIMINFTSDGKIDTQQNMMGMNIDVKGTIKSTGTITLNRTTGILKQKIASTTTETASNLGGQEMNTTSKMNAVVTVKTL